MLSIRVITLLGLASAVWLTTEGTEQRKKSDVNDLMKELDELNNILVDDDDDDDGYYENSEDDDDDDDDSDDADRGHSGSFRSYVQKKLKEKTNSKKGRD